MEGDGIKIWAYDAVNDVWREVVVNGNGELVIVAA